jgi:hypothetical protein
MIAFQAALHRRLVVAARCSEMTPKKLYPTDQNIWLFIADSIRSEPQGKITLIGYFGGETINVPMNVGFPVTLPISLMFQIRDGIGAFSAEFAIQDADGNTLLRQLLPSIEKREDNHGIIINTLITINQIGNYAAVLSLDGKEYTRTIKVGYS